MAFVVHSVLLASGAVGEGDVVVGNIVEEVDFLLFQGEAGSDGVDRSVAPAFVEETAVLVERLEVVNVGGAAEPVEVTDFEVGPLIWVSLLAESGGLRVYSRNGSGCRCHRRRRRGNP